MKDGIDFTWANYFWSRFNLELQYMGNRMISLKEATIQKYKSVESDQRFEVDEKTTVLVGMNESGKTSVLEALAKTRYFSDDEDFVFNLTHDYPRREKKAIEKSGQNPAAITCVYQISDSLMSQIEKDVGPEVFISKEFSITTKYDNTNAYSGVDTNIEALIKNKTREDNIDSTALIGKLVKVKSADELTSIRDGYKDDKIISGINSLNKYFVNEWNWGSSAVSEYIARTYLKPNLPVFLYYDEFYSLPSRISIEKLKNEQLESNDLKTAKALFELADINVDELISAEDFEDYKAELEATEATITQELFKYWSTNTNLDIKFDIDKKIVTGPQGNQRIAEHILDIRVWNSRARVSLPLKNRSKGFNWFFSFLVWFQKIQEDKDTSYILLLDEPGLNLHASAQSDLLRFISDLATDYQIIYTTHSPFMVDPAKLHHVRTVVESDKGSVISDSIQEKDPKTLFPLQAALGYDIAQNLFISKNNLLVEGVSDLIFLEVMSGILQEEGRNFLREDITIVPVGGLEKVSTFVSLMRGTKLNIVCLLDSSIDVSSKTKLDNLVREKIIKDSTVRYYDEFRSDSDEADVEDLFAKDEYLELFNASFDQYSNIDVNDLDSSLSRVIAQINKHLSVERFNHYRPANELAKKGANTTDFSEGTINKFSELFGKINSLFPD
ncbi:MAG: AAA family ATPase [Gammaproteobacteria bacterium]